MLHDADVYPDPMAFNPDRYCNDDSAMLKVYDLAFGFGRRTCAGMHFADATLFAIVTTVLATCEILPGIDAEGNSITPALENTPSGIIVSANILCLPSSAHIRFTSPSVAAAQSPLRTD